MKIYLKKQADDFHMLASNESGECFNMDALEEIGGKNKGMKPMQVLLTSLGGCSSIDVLLVLKKQKQQFTDFEVELEAERVPVENYSLFKDITIHFKIKGQVDEAKAHKAIQLSLEKYCSVAKTLEPTATIKYKLTIN